MFTDSGYDVDTTSKEVAKQAFKLFKEVIVMTFLSKFIGLTTAVILLALGYRQLAERAVPVAARHRH